MELYWKIENEILNISIRNYIKIIGNKDYKFIGKIILNLENKIDFKIN